jgi:hypothetical protein
MSPEPRVRYYFGADLENAAYAPDTTTVDLCLSLFPWAKFHHTKAP